MRFAIISDIHSNLEALEAALNLIDTHNVDEIVCLGDVVGYAANPNECLTIVRQRCSMVLLGNHDAAAIDPSVSENFTDRARVAALWTAKQLTHDHKEYLQKRLYTESRHGFFFAHASPWTPDQWDYITSAYEATLALRYFDEPICFLGHTHQPVIFSEEGRERRVERNRRYIINVGSIGQPRDGNPLLSFGIFDTDRWEYVNVRGEYDIDTAAEKILRAGLPRSLAERLSVGV